MDYDEERINISVKNVKKKRKKLCIESELTDYYLYQHIFIFKKRTSEF